jgi:exosome complex component RRP4
MSELLIKNRQVVVPGQVLATGLDYLPGQGAYRFEDNILANRVGLVSIKGRAIKLISLAGVYIPKPNDMIIGKVTDVTLHGWRIDTNTAYSAMLSSKEVNTGYVPFGTDLVEILSLGDWVAVSIVKVTSQFITDVSMVGPGLRKLPSGRIFKVSSMKVPRIIGKQGSMISMIKENTGCQIMIGQNGVVWLRGAPQAEIVAVDTIKMICDLAHTSGLTERVKAYLEENCKDIDFSAFQAQVEEEKANQRQSFQRSDRPDRHERSDRGDRGDRPDRGGRDRDGGERKTFRRRSFQRQ